MAYLDWIGKRAVVDYHKQIPLVYFENEGKQQYIDINSNYVINGDNLSSLRALLPYYAGKIKCIYIDPPYNTGNENWVYNDNVNSPEIREWLGKVVGKDAIDLSRHDKWLCMMYPRLVLARELLSDDGIIFISIDDNEYHRLIYLLEEIFNIKNQLANFIWQTEGNFDNQAKVKINHEYVVAYCKDINRFPAPPIIDPNTKQNSKLFKKIIRNTIVKNGPKNPESSITIPVGFPCDFESGIIKKRDNKWPHYDRDLIVENYKTTNDVVVSSGWSSKNIFTNYLKNEFKPVVDTKDQMTEFIITKTGAIETLKYRKEDQSHVVSVLREMGSTQQASSYLSENGIEFDYPKPVDLIKYLLNMNTGNDYITLDFFAGSGTTAQAVMELNQIDHGKRKFILVEWDKHIFDDICIKRLRRVSEITSNYFDVLQLGEAVYDRYGLFSKELSWMEIARYIYFKETGKSLNIEQLNMENGYIGHNDNKQIYLLYNSESPIDTIGLNLDVCVRYRDIPGVKVIYGIECSLSEHILNKYNIVFKQIPYESGGR